MKKRFYLMTILTIILAVFIGRYFLTRPVTLTFQSVDENGTPLLAPQKITRSFLRGYTISAPRRRGYKLTNSNKINGRFPLKNQTIFLHFKPIQNQHLDKINKAKYVSAAFEVMNTAPTSQWQADPKQWDGGIDRLRIMTSNDGVHWTTLATNYPNINVRDPSIIKYKDSWYICYTNGLLRTTDFKNWQQMPWKLDTKRFAFQWAPEFLIDANNKYHVIMSNQPVKKPYDTAFQSYICDFDPQTGEIKNNWTKITGPGLPNNMIDSHIDIVDHQYRLWYKNENTKQLKLAVSNRLATRYANFNTVIQPNTLVSYEGQFTLPRSNHEVRLYVDAYIKELATYKGVHYIDSSNGLTKWTEPKPIKADFLVRHFSIWQNQK